MSDCTCLAFADSSFANVEGVKSQYGQVIVLTNQADDYVKGDYSKGALL